MQHIFPTSGNLLTAIEVQHGPASVLGRLFLQAEAAARECGITLSFADPGELAAVNRANQDTWRPILPLFDCEASGFGPDRGFALLGRDSSGAVVATQGARVYDWTASSFLAEATSLRMFYGDRPAPAEEACVVDAPSASAISGRVVFSGAGWYRPDFRKRGLACILPRVSRALAYTRCLTDYTISIMADAVAAGGMAERSGYTKVEKKVELINSPVGKNVSCVLVWMDTNELLGDIDRFLSGRTAVRPQVDSVVDDRPAQHARVA